MAAATMSAGGDKHSVSALDWRAFERIMRRLEPDAKLMTATPMQGGTSASMTLLEYELTTGARRGIVVRRSGERTRRNNPRAIEDEFRVLQIAQALDLPSPRALLLDHEGDPPAYMVLDYIDGAAEFAPLDVDRCVRALAEQLAVIHRADPAGQDLYFLPGEPRRLRGSEPSARAQPNRRLDRPAIYDALGRMGAPAHRNDAVLLHGDYWPCNVLWKDGGIAAVIDWEDAAFGDPLIDLATARLDIATIFGIEAMAAFTDQYRALMPHLVYDALPYWDLRASLRFARFVGEDAGAWAAYFAPFGRDDITDESIRRDYAAFVDVALG